MKHFKALITISFLLNGATASINVGNIPCNDNAVYASYEAGKTYSGYCEADCKGAIYGSPHAFTSDTNICAAAWVAGFNGGKVVMEILGEQSSFKSVPQPWGGNTNAYGSFPKAYKFLATSTTTTTTPEPTAINVGNIPCSDNADQNKDIEEYGAGKIYSGYCEADCKEAVFGSPDAFTSDTKICAAAWVAGFNGGKVVIEILGEQSSYKSVPQPWGGNTIAYGSYPKAYKFHATDNPTITTSPTTIYVGHIPCSDNAVKNKKIEDYGIGKTYLGNCEADCKGTVWGSPEAFTSDSWICSAARVAGVNGGKVFIEMLGEQPSFASVPKPWGGNTNAYGSYPNAYKFLATSTTTTTTPEPTVTEVGNINCVDTADSNTQIDELDVGQKFSGNCEADCKKGVWGSPEAYTSDSSVCSAAWIAGINGGKVVIEIIGEQQSFTSVPKPWGGVTGGYSKWPRAYKIGATDNSPATTTPEPTTTSVTTSATTEATHDTFPTTPTTPTTTTTPPTVCEPQFADTEGQLETTTCTSMAVKDDTRACTNMFDGSLSRNVKEGTCFVTKSNYKGWAEIHLAQSSQVTKLVFLSKGNGDGLAGTIASVCVDNKKGCKRFGKIYKVKPEKCTILKGETPIVGNMVRLYIADSNLVVCEMRVYGKQSV